MSDEIPHNRDITYFGKTNFRNSDDIFGIKRKDRRQHMYVLGKSGTGKSVLLSNLIVQNIQNGEGVCVVDPHGELVEEILHLIPDHRVKDVIYFNPADTEFHIGFNVIQLDDPKYKHLVASGLMGIFTKIWANAWSSRMEYILNNAILALLDTPGTTLLGIPRLLVDKDYRQMIIGNLKDPVVKAFWVHEYEQWREQFRNEAIAPIQNKVGQFLSTSIIRNVVGQPKSTIDIFKIMNEGKIFLVNVSKGRIGEDNSALLGGMIITKIQLAAMERVRIPEDDRKDFYLYVDEFQNFATDSFANILSEARKYRLNLTVAHQYTAQLENKDGSKVRDAVFGNVGTMIIFRVGADDADFLEKEFEPEFTAQDLVNLPNFHIYLKLMIDGITSRPFSATTLPPIKIDLAKGVKEKIIESSRKLYTRPREEVENEISKWSGMLQVGDGDAKYKADCSNCGKSTMVPFEPKEGRPVYCKECMFKIKSGELKPESGFVASRSANQEEKVSTEPLAALGIEFTPMVQKAGAPHNNFSGFSKPKDTPYKASEKYNNKSKTNASNFTDKRKHAGPSPLLRGLLDKITKSGKDTPIENKGIKIEEKVKIIPKQEPMSLSKLKENKNNIAKTPNISQLKEASDEKKSSLRDVLSKINTVNKKPILPAKEEEKPKEIIAPKKEEVLVKSDPVVITGIKEEVSVKPESVVISEMKQEEILKIDEPIIKPIIKEDIKKEVVENKSEKEEIRKSAFVQDLNDAKEETKDSHWQKRKAKKEVPEDVLRKVLE
jgi:CxxC-x17-CxxC domain-containing protein